jgi:ureidoglycolate hydrolase
VNGEAQVINIGAVLPANAIVLAHEINLATPFSGGSVAACAIDVGGTDPNAICNSMTVFTGAPTGAQAFSPLGDHPYGKFSAEQLAVTFSPDGAHALLALSAGSLTITIWFSILA